jgi:hypothetical protein
MWTHVKEWCRRSIARHAGIRDFISLDRLMQAFAKHNFALTAAEKALLVEKFAVSRQEAMVITFLLFYIHDDRSKSAGFRPIVHILQLILQKSYLPRGARNRKVRTTFLLRMLILSKSEEIRFSCKLHRNIVSLIVEMTLSYFVRVYIDLH